MTLLIALRVSVSSEAPWNSGGYSIDADADDRALALHQPRHRVVGADRAGVGQA